MEKIYPVEQANGSKRQVTEKIQGVEERTSMSGFHVMRIHYTADPERNPVTEEGKVWFENAVRGLPDGIKSANWRREQEIDWYASGGDLVFPQFAPFREKICIRPFSIDPAWGWKLFASFDYGHRNPSAFYIHTVDYDGNIYTIWEYYKTGQGYRDMARAFRECEYFDRLTYPPIADPSIFKQDQQSENGVKSIGQLFAELPPDEQVLFIGGLKGGDVTAAERINGLLWKDIETRDPQWRIFQNCPMMIWELEKLRYEDWSQTQMASRNLKEALVDKDNHAWDAVKYFLAFWFEKSLRPETDKYEHLKHLDPLAYREWTSVDKQRRERALMTGAMGEWD